MRVLFPSQVGNTQQNQLIPALTIHDNEEKQCTKIISSKELGLF